MGAKAHEREGKMDSNRDYVLQELNKLRLHGERKRRERWLRMIGEGKQKNRGTVRGKLKAGDGW